MEPWVIQVVGTVVQTGILLAGAFIAIGGARKQLENLDKRVDKLETAFITLARTDERMNAMDQRMLTQGRRLDRVADQLFRQGRSATGQTQEETN